MVYIRAQSSYTPRTQSVRGVYWIQLACLSVCLSVDGILWTRDLNNPWSEFNDTSQK